jgi:hypothetical protein
MKDAFGVSKSGIKDLPKFLPKGKETTKAIKLRAHAKTNEGNMDARLRGFGQTKKKP